MPQFIEKESKLIGPLTLRQFLWCVGGATLWVIFDFLLTGTALIIVTVIIAAFTLCLAYLKIDEVPFPSYLGRAMLFLVTDKKYTYQKEDNPLNPPYDKGGTGG